MPFKMMNGADFNGQRAQNASDPSSASDLATKAYVDSLLQGAKWKNSVKAATTANITLSNPGTSTFDSITLTSGDRLLVMNQSTGSQNGIYTFNGSGSALTRVLDADTAAELNGAAVYVEQGTANGDKAFVETATITTLGTDTVTFAQLAGGSSYTADGQGIELSGTTFSLELDTNSGLTKSATGLKVSGGTGISVTSTVAIDTSVVVRKNASADIGDGSTTAIVVTHNLGTRDVDVSVYDKTSFERVYPDINHTTTNTVTITFPAAPTTNQYRAVIHG